MTFTFDFSLESAAQKLAHLRATHLYCAECGTPMKFEKTRIYKYDRATGVRFNEWTYYRWICQRYKEWEDKNLACDGPNPHDFEVIPTQEGDPLS